MGTHAPPQILLALASQSAYQRTNLNVCKCQGGSTVRSWKENHKVPQWKSCDKEKSSWSIFKRKEEKKIF